MTTARIISAICTPLAADESLHVDGLEVHVGRQWQAGVSSLLVGGTMGAMQLQRDRTYAQLIEHAARITGGRGELLVGVGDASYARTRERIDVAQRFDIDGVVALPPYFIKPTQ